MEYKWGIIGAGRFADNVFAPAIKQSKNSRLWAIMARDKTKAEAFAKKHEVPKFYDSAEALCNDEEINVVYIASPTFLHCEHTVLAAQCDPPWSTTFIYIKTRSNISTWAMPQPWPGCCFWW